MVDNKVNYANIAYAKINLDFDQEKFIYEFDRYILPRSKHIYNGVDNVDQTTQLNRSWQMVDPDIYVKQDVNAGACYSARQTIVRGFRTWRQCTLTYLETTDHDDHMLRDSGTQGSLVARNYAYDRQWHVKKEFQQLGLSILDFIETEMLLQKIVWISAVSLEPGEWASIHRDSIKLYRDDKNPVCANHIAQAGLVVVVLNISDGGVPLYWSLDGPDQPVRSINDKVYMHSDYFLHGTPRVVSRRRQIRITGYPKPEFYNIIDFAHSHILPHDYQYQLHDWEQSMIS